MMAPAYMDGQLPFKSNEGSRVRCDRCTWSLAPTAQTRVPWALNWHRNGASIILSSHVAVRLGDALNRFDET